MTDRPSICIMMKWWVCMLLMGFGVTFGFYKLMRNQQNGGPRDEEGYPMGTWLWHMMCRLGNWTHREDKRSWRVMRWLMDGPMMRGR